MKPSGHPTMSTPKWFFWHLNKEFRESAKRRRHPDKRATMNKYIVRPPRLFIFFFRECEKVEAIVSVKEGSVSMTEPRFPKALIKCGRLRIIWRKRQIHESAKGTDHESDRKLGPFALICTFHKKLIKLCDSPKLKASIVEPGGGSRKGTILGTFLGEGEEIRSGLERFFWGICILGHLVLVIIPGLPG